MKKRNKTCLALDNLETGKQKGKQSKHSTGTYKIFYYLMSMTILFQI